VLALAGTISAACAPDAEGGFDKVADRAQPYIASPAMPDPPPVTASLQPAAAEIDFASISFPAGVSAEMAEEGQQLYGTVCSACHGAGGVGGAVAPPLNDGDWLNISGEYDDIVGIIHSGVANPVEYPGVMPALGGGNFDDQQVRAIASYVYALSHQSGT
jgi:mono/diheme cytochrome c family protein